MANEVIKIGINKLAGKDLSDSLTAETIQDSLKSTKDSVIVFDKEGKVVLLNQSAADYFMQPMEHVVGHYLSKILPLQKLAHKKMFCKAINYFNQAVKGVPQQFNWVEYDQNKQPLQAFNVILTALTLDNQPLVVARIIDITQAKTLEWVLWSLAEISNHGGINDVIDGITALVSTVFHAEKACVNLIDHNNIVHSVSHYQQGRKQGNISYPLPNTPCAEVKKSKQIYHHHGDLSKQFPAELNLSNPSYYVGGPLINSEGLVIGTLILLNKHKIDLHAHNKTLFKLFSERVSLEIERLISHRKLQFLASIPQQDPNPVFRTHAGGQVLYTNRSGKEILNHWYKEYKDLPTKLKHACDQAKQYGDVVRVELEVMNKNYLFIVVWIADFDQVNIYATDITELKQAQQRMRDLANYDTLTNVGNRQFFETTLNKWLEQSKRNQEELALLLIDIDNFKTVNDTLGHHVGDKLLKNVAKRMAGCIRKEDFIGRLGGDEFVVLIIISEHTDIEKVAEKINQSLAAPFEFGEYHLETGCSIGISYYPSCGITASELLRNADTAMYQAKKNGKNQYAIYSSASYNEVNNRHILLKKDLKNALANQQFYIDYQPQFDIHSKKIVGYEAFIRWRHPQKGLISPSEFIPLAEQTGTMYALGYWTIQQALHDFSSTIIPINAAKISLNIAISQLKDQNFIDNLCESLDKSRVPKQAVVLDIAEQITTLQYRHLDNNLATLRAAGINLSLDNFGADHSNLSRLVEVPFDYVKIDHSLLHSLEDEPRREAFISGIIDLANKLKLNVIQKGVENAQQNELLKNLGCQYAQGFYYCRPLPIDILEVFINDYFNRQALTNVE